ncbi:unnamed protein product [Lupinus luteus]|uniref:RNase H type-1 domain-containing protein n=1 Tax=Lupinus luteus TaxID=3873 RepID=A0AAV1WCW5_LUPLU
MEQSLMFALNLGFKKISLECDYLEVVHLISERSEIRLNGILRVVFNVRTWISHDWTWRLSLLLEMPILWLISWKTRLPLISNSPNLEIWAETPPDCQPHLDLDSSPLC